MAKKTSKTKKIPKKKSKKTVKVSKVKLKKKIKKILPKTKLSSAKTKKKTAKKTALKLKARKAHSHPIKKIKIQKLEAVPLSVSSSDGTLHKTKIRVIGIGGGGNSIISEIADKVKKVDFVVVNTDSRALREASLKAKKIQFGQSVTKGLGTGMNPQIGEAAAENDKEKIKKLFEGQDLCIMVACLGGGTSSGATPVFAKIARSIDCLTYGIFTLPFKFEGEKKMEIALDSINKIKPHLNVYSVIPNESIFQTIDKNTPLKSALSVINKKLSENLEGLIEMIYLPGLINIDFADLRTVLGGRGKLAYLDAVEIEGADKEEAARKVISSSLYPYTVKGARGILYNIVGGKDLQLSEVSQISRVIYNSVNKTAKIIFGIGQNGKYHNKIKITVLATGCGSKALANENLKPNPVSLVLSRFKPKVKSPKAQENIIKNMKNAKKKTKKLNKEKTTGAAAKSRKIVLVSKRIKEKPKAAKEAVLASEKLNQPEKQAQLSTFNPAEALEKIKDNNQEKATPPAIKAVHIPVREEQKQVSSTLFSNSEEGKIRRNGLQLKKAMEEEEKKILEEEEVWETPAFLRKQKEDN